MYFIPTRFNDATINLEVFNNPKDLADAVVGTNKQIIAALEAHCKIAEMEFKIKTQKQIIHAVPNPNIIKQ